MFVTQDPSLMLVQLCSVLELGLTSNFPGIGVMGVISCGRRQVFFPSWPRDELVLLWMGAGRQPFGGGVTYRREKTGQGRSWQDLKISCNEKEAGVLSRDRASTHPR